MIVIKKRKESQEKRGRRKTYCLPVENE